jgi:hypothetical protein
LFGWREVRATALVKRTAIGGTEQRSAASIVDESQTRLLAKDLVEPPEARGFAQKKSGKE